MADATTIVSVISAATALVASVTGPLVAIYVGRIQVRAAVLSANRQRWIDEFRTLIAEFCAQLAVAVPVRGRLVKDGAFLPEMEPEALHQFERLVLVASRIRLMINPLDDDHQELLVRLEGLLDMFRTSTSDDLQREAEAEGRRLLRLSHAVLRREWQRVQRGG